VEIESTTTCLKIVEYLSKSAFMPEEKERLQLGLASSESDQFGVFWDNLEGSSVWGTYASKLKVKGFRIGIQSKAKKIKVKEQLKINLASGKLTKNDWNLYFQVCESYIQQKHPALYEQMNEELEIDGPLLGGGYQANELSRILICSLRDNAKDAGIYSSQILEIYNLFSVARIQDIDLLLESVPEYSAMDKMKEELDSLRSDFTELKANQSARLDVLRDEARHSNTSIDNKTAALEESQREMQDFFGSSLDHLALRVRNEVGEDLKEWKKDVEELHGKTRTEYEEQVLEAELERAFLKDAFQEQVKNISIEMEAVAEEIRSNMKPATNLASVTFENDQPTIQDQGWLWNTLKRKGSVSVIPPDLASLTEPEFIDIFARNVANSGLRYKREDLTLYHHLIVGMPVIIVDDADLMNCWIKSLNWVDYHHQMCASPLWSDPNIWSMAQRELFTDDSHPAIVSVLNFDKGLVSCYLDPVLKIWMQADFQDTTKKLFLVTSDLNDLDRQKKISVPAVYLNRYRPNINTIVSQPGGAAAESRVSSLAFRSWSAASHQVEPNLEQNDLLKNLVGDQKILPRSLVTGVNKLLHNLDRLVERPIAEKLCLELFIGPWLEELEGG
jgi:hypothetical protein